MISADFLSKISFPLFRRSLQAFGGLLLCAAMLPAAFADPASVIRSHGIAMHGEPKYPRNFSGFEYTSPRAIKGGRFRQAGLGTFDSLNPFIPKGNAADNLGLVYDTLTVQAMDEPFTQYGLLAETIEYPSDRSWVTYYLRKEARFHDGHPITAEDVVFTFYTLMEKGSPYYAFYYADVDKVEALDPHTVKFSFASTENKELPLIVGSLPVLPKHFWDDKKFDESSLELPLGSGPYRVSKVNPGRRITFERVVDYWAKDLAVNRGMYNFDRIEVDYYRDPNIATEAFKSGEYDYRWENSSKNWAVGYDIPAVRDGMLIKQQIPHSAPTGMQAFIFNIRRPVFADRELRRAMSYAFDFEWSNKTLFYGAYRRTDSFFANSELASSGLPQGRELEILEPYRDQLPASVFTEVYQPPKTDGSGNIRPNLRIAKKILDRAGYRVKDNQLYSPQGVAVKFEVMMYDQMFERIMNPFAHNLKRLGIKAELRLIDTSQYINRMRKYDFDMMVDTIPASLSPGNEQREFWGSRAAQTPNSRNRIGVQDPVVDALVEGIIQAPSREELVAYVRALDRVLLHQHYVIPQWMKPSSNLVYWDKFEQPKIPPKYDRAYTTGVLTWWYNPEKAQRLKRYRGQQQ